MSEYVGTQPVTIAGPSKADKAATLISLAMLKVNSDVEGRDYLDYITPFIGYVLNKHKPDPVTPAAVQQLLRQEFGLSIPQHPTEFALRRLADQKHIRRDNYVYRIVGLVPIADIESRRDALRKEQQTVVGKLREFSEREQVPRREPLAWSEDQARDVLLSYVRRFSIECLRTYTHGSPLPATSPLTERGLLTVNLFVKEIYERERKVFESLIVIVKGHMLANALVCSDLKSITRDFGSVTFFLDTPLALRLLGLEGDERATAVEELVELLQKLRGQCAVFDHTLDEIRAVIDMAERNLDNPRARGRVAEEARRRGTTKSDLQLLSGRIEEKLKAIGVGTRRTPRYDAHRAFQIDETLLQEAIADEIKYMNPRALEYDVNSVRSIYALRHGKMPGRLEDAGVILVTSNSPLARATFDYGREHESSRAVSAVITDFSLANVAWLKAPLKAPDLPELEVIAACYAALEPAPPLWNRYVNEIDKLRGQGEISADDHQLLRHSPIARTKLMNLTGGSEQEFSATTISDILTRMKADIRNEMTAEREELLRSGRALLDEEKARNDAERSAVEDRAAKAAADRLVATELASHAMLQREKARHKISSLAVTVGRVIKAVASVLLAACVLVTLLIGSTKADSIGAKVAWIVGPIVGIGLLLAYLDNVHELSVKKIGAKLEEWVRDRVNRFLLRRLLEDEARSESRPGPTAL